MVFKLDSTTLRFIREHRVARLATADAQGQPMVVPVCYVFDGNRVYSPIDEKPKSVDGAHLKRVRNIQENPRVSVVIDDYSEDWTKLRHVIISGVAEAITASSDSEEHARAVELLREKYPQYRAMAIDRQLILRITPTRVKEWTAE